MKLKAPGPLDRSLGHMTWAKGQRHFPGKDKLKWVSEGGNQPKPGKEEGRKKKPNKEAEEEAG